VVLEAFGTISLADLDVACGCTVLRHVWNEDGQADEEVISTCPHRGRGASAIPGGCGSSSGRLWARLGRVRATT